MNRRKGFTVRFEERLLVDESPRHCVLLIDNEQNCGYIFCWPSHLHWIVFRNTFINFFNGNQVLFVFLCVCVCVCLWKTSLINKTTNKNKHNRKLIGK